MFCLIAIMTVATAAAATAAAEASGAEVSLVAPKVTTWLSLNPCPRF